MGNNISQNASLELREAKKYTIYQSVADIPYTPEEALKEGLEMVKYVKAYMSKLTLGSKLRQEVWNRELAKYVVRFFLSPLLLIACSLEAQTRPKTLIAVCGGMSVIIFTMPC